MNQLSVISRQNQCRPDISYPMLAMDGLYLDLWLSQFVDKKPFVPDKVDNVADLAMSLDLYLPDEMATVWHYLGQLNAGDRSIVPLLVCPDCLDLTCMTVVAEQEVTEQTVSWKRFGWALDDVKVQAFDKVDWFQNVPELVFFKDSFIATFSEFKVQILAEYDERLENITIDFPTEP